MATIEGHGGAIHSRSGDAWRLPRPQARWRSRWITIWRGVKELSIILKAKKPSELKSKRKDVGKTKALAAVCRKISSRRYWLSRCLLSPLVSRCRRQTSCVSPINRRDITDGRSDGGSHCGYRACGSDCGYALRFRLRLRMRIPARRLLSRRGSNSRGRLLEIESSSNFGFDLSRADPTNSGSMCFGLDRVALPDCDCDAVRSRTSISP